MKRVILLILFILFVFFSAFYVKLDKEAGICGLSSFFGKNQLPYGICSKTESCPPNFLLIDPDGYEMLGIGFGILGSDFIINDLLSFGYNDTSIIVKCQDSAKNIRYLISYKTNNKYKNGIHEIYFFSINDNNIGESENKYKYKWFDISTQHLDYLIKKRFLCLLLSICILLIGVIIFWTSKFRQ